MSSKSLRMMMILTRRHNWRMQLLGAMTNFEERKVSVALRNRIGERSLIAW